MFKPQNKVIIIDNNIEHLKTLSARFHSNGIGCKEFEYDAFYDNPLTGIRVAFFDINLLDQGGGDNRIFNTLAIALKQYIHINNGPFALIFWTSNSQKIEDFKVYVENRHNNCPRPFVVKFIEKDDFLGGEDEELERELNEILSDRVLKLMFDFEERAMTGAYDVVKDVYNIIPSKDSWGANTNFSLNFERVFSKISTSTLGFSGAKNNPDRAVYEALTPMLTHQILKDVNSQNWQDYLISLAAANEYRDLKNPQGFKESKINSVFHIDKSKSTIDTRGIVLKMSKNHSKFVKNFGISYREWLFNFIPFKRNTDSQRLDVEKLIRKSELIVVEISSACDFQQNKSRLNKYIYGVKFPVIRKNLLSSKKEAALDIGKYNLDNKEFEIWLNLNYVFGTRSSDNIFKSSKYLFTLKKEIMDMIGNRYANHVSRIGITSF